jgi:hypothetical protein
MHQAWINALGIVNDAWQNVAIVLLGFDQAHAWGRRIARRRRERAR